jgi:hypothetical protein
MFVLMSKKSSDSSSMQLYYSRTEACRPAERSHVNIKNSNRVQSVTQQEELQTLNMKGQSKQTLQDKGREHLKRVKGHNFQEPVRNSAIIEFEERRARACGGIFSDDKHLKSVKGQGFEDSRDWLKMRKDCE